MRQIHWRQALGKRTLWCSDPRTCSNTHWWTMRRKGSKDSSRNIIHWSFMIIWTMWSPCFIKSMRRSCWVFILKFLWGFKEFCLCSGNSLISESQLKCLKDYNYSNFLVVQKISQIPCNNKLDEIKCMDITSRFAQNEGITLLRIDGFDISCKNKINLKKWAHFFNLLFNKNEVFWCFFKKDSFSILFKENLHLLVRLLQGNLWNSAALFEYL